MSLQRQVMFWLLALFALVLTLWVLSDVLLPFIAGLVLAYFLDPVADRLEKLGMPRLAATLVILLCAVFAVASALIILVPILSDQIGKFANDLPGMIHSLVERFDEFAPQWLKDIVAKSGADVQGSMTEIASKAAGWIVTILGSILTGGMALVNLLSLLVITPIVAFYLLEDWDKIVATVDSWLPRQNRDKVRQIARDIDTSLAGFIRGQGTVCLLLGAFYAVSLSMAGLKFGVAVGITAGLLTFIPYAGALIGGILAIGISLVQFWPDYGSILAVVAIFAAGQFVEGNFLSPKLVGKSIGLHPVWMMFALFAFGYLFGFVGLILAVPLAAAAGVLARFGLQQYLASKIYLGSSDEVREPIPVAKSKRQR